MRTGLGYNDVLALCATYMADVDACGELSHPLRRQLHSEIERLAGVPCWNSYISLSTMCAVKAWPVWVEKFVETLPNSAPVAGATLVNPHLNLAADLGQLGELSVFLDNHLRVGPEAFPAVAAGLACWAVSRDVLVGTFSMAPNLVEIESDSEGWESSAFSVIAISGGAAWEPASDSSKRKDFWKWYLSHAVPIAYSDSGK